MDDIVLKILDSDNNLDFEIPLTSLSNNVFALSKQLSDIADLTKRYGVQSRNFKIPISKEVAQNYDFFNQAQHYNYKDIDADKNCIILQGKEEIERGKIRIINNTTINNVEQVELLFFGNNYEWKEGIKDLTFKDLPFTNNSITYTPTVITSSWLNTVDNGDEWVFPLENRGGRKNLNSVTTEDFRPSIFFYKVLELALKTINYSFESTFMSGVEFKKLVISHFGERYRNTIEDIIASTVLENKTFGNNADNNNAGTRYPVDYVSSVRFGKSLAGGTGAFRQVTPININIKNGATAYALSFDWNEVSDVSNNFDPTAGTYQYDLEQAKAYRGGRYIAPQSGSYKINVKADFGVWLTPNPQTPSSPQGTELKHTIFVNKFDTAGNSTQVTTGYYQDNTITIHNPSDTYTNIVVDDFVEVYLAAGEGVELWKCIDNYDITPRYHDWGQVAYRNVEMSIELVADKKENDVFNLSDVVDDKIKVIDIINDVSRKFNLMWDADPVLKKITVEPRNTFYDTIANAVDYTANIDLDKEIKTVFNSSLHKKDLDFKYAQDSADVFVSERNKRQGNLLFNYSHSLPAKFKDGLTTISTSVLAPTYLIKDVDSIDDANNHLAPYTARYWNTFSETTPYEMLENHAPRLLYYSFAEQTDGTDLFKFKMFSEVNDRTKIPALLSYSVIVNGVTQAASGFNLAFHNIGTQSGLMETYWGKTLTEIIQGKKTTLSMWFNKKLWIDFKFKRVIYISSPIEIKGYYTIEKIANYQPERSGLVKVSLLKREEYETELESTAVALEFPLISGDEIQPQIGVPMTTVIIDANGNEALVNMQGLDSKGKTTTLI